MRLQQSNSIYMQPEERGVRKWIFSVSTMVHVQERNWTIQQTNLSVSETRTSKITSLNLFETPKMIYKHVFHLSLTSDIQMHFVTRYSAHRAGRKALIFSNISIVFRPLVNYSGDNQCSIGSYTSSRIGDDFLSVLLPRYLGRRRWTFHSTVQCNGLIFPSYCVRGFLAKA